MKSTPKEVVDLYFVICYYYFVELVVYADIWALRGSFFKP